MEKDPNNSVSYNSSPTNDENAEKSIVGKFRSIINSTPLSKWFGKQEDSSRSVRRREDAEDDEIRQMQPPSKRVKLPVGAEQNNSVIFNTLDSIIPVDISVANKTVNHFPEPVAGPSGITSRKLLSSVTTTISKNSVKNTFRSSRSSDLLNGHKDSDSEESTSGYSSVARIGSKEHVSHSQESSKQTSPLQNNPSNTRSLFQSPNTTMNRSLFADRNSSPKVNTSMTSRRPSFNASTFGSPNFVDNTITTEKITNSPFYNGRTIYGGASAYGRRLGRSVRDLRTSLKNSVQIKPVNKSNENGNLALGKTARRILETLEEYSSPVNDAKKIPVTSKRFRPDGYISQHVGASPYMVRGSEVPSNKELQVPTVSDLLKMKQKMKLQQSTEVVRQIAISSKSKLNTKDTCIENRSTETGGNDASKEPELGSKEVINQTKPTPPSLPVTKLPKFDVFPEQSKKKSPKNLATGFPGSATAPISFSFNSQPTAKTVKTNTNTKTEESTVNSKSFKFSEPLVVSENFKSIIAINNFKFSEPLCNVSKTGSSKEKLAKSDVLLNNKQSFIELQKTPTNGTLQKKTPESDDRNTFGMQFKISSNKWECNVCMIRNKETDVKCAACTAPKPSSNKWECNVCMIRNKETDVKCVACTAPKPSSNKWECNVCLILNKDTDVKCVACTAPKPSSKPVVESVKAPPPSTFGDKFNMPSTMWECSVCMIRNENYRTKCSACEAPNRKSTPSFNFGAKFQSPTTTWECSTCLINNKDDAGKCVACETPKPRKQPANSLGAVFKMKENEWECTVCMVRNKSSNIKCQCCEAAKPGSSPSALVKDPSDKKPLMKFNFGIDKAVANSFRFGIPAGQASTLPKPAVDPSTVFGENAKTAAPAAKFSFGVPVESKEKETKPVEADKPAAEKAQPILPAVVPKTTSEKELVKGSVASAGLKLGEKVPTSISQALAAKKNEESAIKPTATVAGSGSVTAKPLFNFAAAVPNKDKPAEKVATETKEASFTAPPPAKLFSFGAKPAVPATTQVPQSTTNAAQANETSKPATTVPVFAFATNKTTSDAAAPPLFGSKTLPTVKNGFDFANTSTFGNTNKPSFDVPPKTKMEAKPFSFGSTASTGEPASKMPMFSFGPPKASQPAQSSGFSFVPAKPAGFNFTAGTTETPTFNAPPASIFGAPTATNNASFTFGSAPQQNTNGQKAGFSFGAPMNSSTSTPAASSGFNFAAAAPAPTLPTGGFNFSEAAAGFGSSKPSFNFTAGSVTSFTAPPSADGATAPRKIKKAVRRTHR